MSGRLRALGYRLLPGDGFSYLLHMRPREWPIMIAHTTLGFLLAWRAANRADDFRGGILAAGLVVWVLLLNGGTLAINSAFDRDEGDIGYLDAPPPPPRHLAIFGFLLMLAGQLLAFAFPAGFTLAYAVCFAMSLTYSVPPVRLKAVAGADWIINILGFGSLTPYAGWAMRGDPLTHGGLLAFVGFAPLFAALYPLTQLYQMDEDRARGDRTLALVLGVRWSLAISILAVLLAFLFFVLAAESSGSGGRFPVTLLALAWVAWMVVLIPWLILGAGLSPLLQKRGMYAALGAWAVTDVAVLVVLGRT